MPHIKEILLENSKVYDNLEFNFNSKEEEYFANQYRQYLKTIDDRGMEIVSNDIKQKVNRLVNTILKKYTLDQTLTQPQIDTFVGSVGLEFLDTYLGHNLKYILNYKNKPEEKQLLPKVRNRYGRYKKYKTITVNDERRFG
jgi:hypothetical protein